MFVSTSAVGVSVSRVVSRKKVYEIERDEEQAEAEAVLGGRAHGRLLFNASRYLTTVILIVLERKMSKESITGL